MNVFAREFRLSEVLSIYMRYWWLLLALTLIGGLLGITISSFREPVYEASSRLLIAIDRNRASLSDRTTAYQADDRVRALLLADSTLEAVLDRSQTSQIESMEIADPQSLREMLKITQDPAGFTLYVYSKDPGLSARLANHWAQAGLDELEQATLHAIRAAEIQAALYNANCTLALQDDAAGEEAVWICSSSGGPIDVQEIPELLVEQARLSRGILPIYSFSIGVEAVIADQPVLWSRGSIVLASSLLGLLLGFIVLLRFNASDRIAGSDRG